MAVVNHRLGEVIHFNQSLLFVVLLSLSVFGYLGVDASGTTDTKLEDLTNHSFPLDFYVLYDECAYVSHIFHNVRIYDLLS